ncbi:lipopolysaccharide biosynthesis protein [Geomesophilobacter sediminis]|uniref:Oligosaccharide flippase family protein n=1 Tax=Geomesophilobacter sediminis TaxID=2798584 RepID=A0A8J7JB18_9BACT|nr:oligosaccharide flippase family protein [Geomesophilobacter sediminis]MBJ6723683.1 oligosaccharide flippase family protein [Geomesophilobacter sediminis]
MSLKRLVKMTSTYMMGEVLIMAGGFISFPIFTRILSKSDYGAMNLIAITLSFVEALSTVGLRHASQRFYPEYTERGLFAEFYATIMRNSVKFGLLGTLGTLAVSVFLAKLDLLPAGTSTLFAVASLLIFIRIVSKITGCLFRIRNQARTYTVFAVGEKYLGMLLSVAFVAYLSKGLFGYYWGLLLGEGVTLALYLAFLLREFGLPRRASSAALFKEMSGYGIPMVLSGFAGIILTMGDRYLIGYFLGTEAVAVYSVPYNLCSYITGILITGFEYAFVPLIMTEWARPGHGETDRQVQEAIKMYCLVALPVICGVIALGREFIALIASKQYLVSTDILPYVITGEMLKGLLTPFIIGLQFHKNTVVMTKITWGVAILNILLNLLLIPRLALIGSALATLISYVVLLAAGAYASGRLYRVAVPTMAILRYLGCSLGMSGFLVVAKTRVPAAGLVPLVLGAALVFALLVLLLDREIRSRVPGLGKGVSHG